MKHKLSPRTVATVAICMSGSLLAGSLLAGPNDTTTPGRATYPYNGAQSATPPAPSTRPLSPASRMSPERLSQLMSATVKDQQGNEVGQIRDFVVSPVSGRIQFVVISLGNQSGRLTAVPWLLIRSGSEPNTCTINATQEKLSGSQTFEAGNWPDFSQPTTSQQIYSYYGVQPARPGARRMTPGANQGQESPENPGTQNPQPPTTPGTPPRPGNPPQQ